MADGKNRQLPDLYLAVEGQTHEDSITCCCSVVEASGEYALAGPNAQNDDLIEVSITDQPPVKTPYAKSESNTPALLREPPEKTSFAGAASRSGSAKRFQTRASDGTSPADWEDQESSIAASLARHRPKAGRARKSNVVVVQDSVLSLPLVPSKSNTGTETQESEMDGSEVPDVSNEFEDAASEEIFTESRRLEKYQWRQLFHTFVDNALGGSQITHLQEITGSRSETTYFIDGRLENFTMAGAANPGYLLRDGRSSVCCQLTAIRDIYCFRDDGASSFPPHILQLLTAEECELLVQIVYQSGPGAHHRILLLERSRRRLDTFVECLRILCLSLKAFASWSQDGRDLQRSDYVAELSKLLQDCGRSFKFEDVTEILSKQNFKLRNVAEMLAVKRAESESVENLREKSTRLKTAAELVQASRMR